MRISTFGGVQVRPAFATTDVSFDGGGRSTTEIETIDSTLLTRRPSKPRSRKVTVNLQGTNGMRKADADALYALYASGEPFTMTLNGYEVSGTFAGCAFEGEPKFPPIPGSALWVRANFTIYIPQ